jgi:hypothetical protein
VLGVRTAPRCRWEQNMNGKVTVRPAATQIMEGPAAAPNTGQALDERNPPRRRGDVCVDFVGLVYVARLTSV